MRTEPWHCYACGEDVAKGESHDCPKQAPELLFRRLVALEQQLAALSSDRHDLRTRLAALEDWRRGVGVALERLEGEER